VVGLGVGAVAGALAAWALPDEERAAAGSRPRDRHGEG
jgi:hypothetical protein